MPPRKAATPSPYWKAAVRDIAAAIGSQHPLVQPLRHAVGSSLGEPQKADVPSQVLDELQIRRRRPPELASAIGEPARGIRAFRASRAEALEAQRIARMAGPREGGITRYRDIGVRALATADVDQARAFVARELGALASADETTRRSPRRRCAPTWTKRKPRSGGAGGSMSTRTRWPTGSGRPRRSWASVDKHTLELRVALAVVDLVGEPSAR